MEGDSYETTADEMRGQILIQAFLAIQGGSSKDTSNTDEEDKPAQGDTSEAELALSVATRDARELLQSSSLTLGSVPSSVTSTSERDENQEERSQTTAQCQAVSDLQDDIIGHGSIHISTWAESHRRAAETDPNAHRTCHRLIWRAVDVLEASHSVDSPTSRDDIISLMREVYILSEQQVFNHRLAGDKLAGLLELRSQTGEPSREDLEEIISIRRNALHARHEVRELNDLECLLRSLKRLGDEECESQNLEERVSLGRQALCLQPGNINHILDLADILQTLGHRTPRPDYLKEASQLNIEKLQRGEGIDCAVLSGMENLYREKGLIRDLSSWLALHRRVVSLAPNSHARCSERLVALSVASQALDEPSHHDGVAIAREALHLTDIGIGISHRLSALDELVERLKARGYNGDSEEAGQLSQQVYELVKASTYRTKKLSCLAGREFRQPTTSRPSNGVRDVSAADSRKAALGFDAIAESMQDSMPILRWLNPLRAVHNEEVRPPDLMEDFADAFRRQVKDQAALDAMPPNSPERANALRLNALALLATNDTKYLHVAVALCRESARCWDMDLSGPVSRNHPIRASLAALGHALYMRHQWAGSLEDIEQAVAVFQLLLRGLEKDSDRLPHMYPMAVALEALFRRLGRREDIVHSLACHRYVLAHGGKDMNVRLIALRGIGKTLDCYYDFYGGVTVLDEAAATVRQAVQLCSTHHPLLSVLLALQGSILRKRHLLLQVPADLPASLQLGNAAIRVSQSSGGHDTDLPTSIALLGETAMVIFEEQHSSEDLEVAITSFRQVMQSRHDTHPDRTDSLSRLGAALCQRYALLSVASDLDESVHLHRGALEAQPDSRHPRYPFWAAGLAAALLLQAKRDNNIELLDEAAVWSEMAVTLVSDTHPSFADVLVGFGDILYARYEVQQDPNDLDQCFKMYAQAASSLTAPSPRCLRYIRTWETLAAKHNHLSIEAAFDASLHHQTRMVNIGRTVQARHDILAKNPVESSRAAAHAISQGKLERAVELLEHGRSIVWQQTLRLRSSMDSLLQNSPSLAAQLSATVRELDSIARVQSVSYHSGTLWSVTDPDRTARYNRELAERYDSLIAEVRKLDGFHRFMQHTTFADLDGIASDGPVILVNICESRCDALLLTASHGIRHVPLPKASFATYEAAQHELTDAAESLEEDTSAHSCQNMDAVLLRNLRMLWETTVEPIVEELRNLGPIPERVFWCMAGAADMPIHAAGPFVAGHPNLPDIVVSSYTPTLTALLRARQSQRDFNTERPDILAISQSSTPGFCDLPGAKVEIGILKETSPFPVTQLSDADASQGNVLQALKSHSWAHFCCHGTVNARQPLLSAFHLQGGNLNIEYLMRANLPTANLAFLSACHTATGSIARNESMSLAAALQVCGFRSVIATMYAIGDEDSPVFAKEVYRYLFRHRAHPPSVADAAIAVNKATRVLQGSGLPLFRWVPFIHIGL